ALTDVGCAAGAQRAAEEPVRSALRRCAGSRREAGGRGRAIARPCPASVAANVRERGSPSRLPRWTASTAHGQRIGRVRRRDDAVLRADTEPIFAKRDRRERDSRDYIVTIPKLLRGGLLARGAAHAHAADAAAVGVEHAELDARGMPEHLAAGGYAAGEG